eukprot:CAMPEP_0206425704 /NCGR_PEP_ID=MMETSP0324_2-20121206/3946_1 /ASSEMBLY_ACC=CAM_ASM_000836 /TAXON_ID=2866 /ORGANISM="Crypthecodinium cohnii, Strain Seligo" /LENGTH=599 /DNA_ID=CAMNT_0053890529 /DNA_START=14 /DNA_END=1813 /DNA_ORIENTATION=-
MTYKADVAQHAAHSDFFVKSGVGKRKSELHASSTLDGLISGQDIDEARSDPAGVKSGLKPERRKKPGYCQPETGVADIIVGARSCSRSVSLRAGAGNSDGAVILPHTPRAAAGTAREPFLEAHGLDQAGLHTSQQRGLHDSKKGHLKVQTTQVDKLVWGRSLSGENPQENEFPDHAGVATFRDRDRSNKRQLPGFYSSNIGECLWSPVDKKHDCTVKITCQDEDYLRGAARQSCLDSQSLLTRGTGHSGMDGFAGLSESGRSDCRRRFASEPRGPGPQRRQLPQPSIRELLSPTEGKSAASASPPSTAVPSDSHSSIAGSPSPTSSSPPFSPAPRRVSAAGVGVRSSGALSSHSIGARVPGGPLAFSALEESKYLLPLSARLSQQSRVIAASTPRSTLELYERRGDCMPGNFGQGAQQRRSSILDVDYLAAEIRDDSPDIEDTMNAADRSTPRSCSSSSPFSPQRPPPDMPPSRHEILSERAGIATPRSRTTADSEVPQDRPPQGTESSRQRRHPTPSEASRRCPTPSAHARIGEAVPPVPQQRTPRYGRPSRPPSEAGSNSVAASIASQRGSPSQSSSFDWFTAIGGEHCARSRSLHR